MNNVDQLQLGFVLHSRPWRETSLLVDIFTENHGKIGLCARGVRSKKSPKRSLLQPLFPLLLCWRGRGELQTLTNLEPAAPAIKLSGNSLYSAFYINELLVRLLHKHDPHPELFNKYQQTLMKLNNAESLEQTLREFELFLLISIGYGLALDHDISGEPIQKEAWYTINIDGALEVSHDELNIRHVRCFKGNNLISIASQNWQNSEILKDAKRLLRLSLQPLLGDKPLQSRKLFRRNST